MVSVYFEFAKMANLCALSYCARIKGKMKQKLVYKKVKGFTLLEVLVAILILALGGVTTLWLQIASIKANTNAKNQATAMQLASDLAGLMRSNPTVASLNNSNNPYLISASGEPSSISEGSGLNTSASPQDIARQDIKNWYARVYSELPKAKVVVCFDTTPFSSDGVGNWECDNDGSLYVKIGWSYGSEEESDYPGMIIPVGVCNPVDSTAHAACVS